MEPVLKSHSAALIALRHAVSLVSMLALGFTWGCSSTVACSDVCSCSGQSGDKTCIATCDQAEADAKKQASQNGCVSQYADLTQCESDNSICDSRKKVYTYPAGVCDSELQTFDKCIHLESGSGSSQSSTGSGSTGTGT